jgi:methionyl-tRNA synthetase
MTRDIDWGIPVPLPGWATTPTRSSTSGSTRSSATSRRRSSGPAAPATPRPGAVVERRPRTAVSYYFMGKDNITFHSQIWPAELLGYAGRGDRGGEPGRLRGAQPADRGGLERVPHDGGAAVLDQPRPRHLCARRPRALRPRCDALLHLRGRPGEPGQRLHLGRVRPAQQLRARRRLGQPRQPDGRDDRQELRRDPAARAARGHRRSRCGTRSPVRSPRSAPCWSATGSRPRSPRTMRIVGEVNAYVSRTEPFKLKGEDERERLATVLHTLMQCVADLNTMLAPFLPHAANRVHLALGGVGEFVPMPVLTDVAGLDDGDSDRSYPVITGDYSGTPRWESTPVLVGRSGGQAGAGVQQARRRPRCSRSGACRDAPCGDRPVTGSPRHRIRCPFRSSTTTPTWTSPRDGTEGVGRGSWPRAGGSGRGRRRPGRADRVRPAWSAGSPSRRPSTTPGCSRELPCTPTRFPGLLRRGS